MRSTTEEEEKRTTEGENASLYIPTNTNEFDTQQVGSTARIRMCVLSLFGSFLEGFRTAPHRALHTNTQS